MTLSRKIVLVIISTFIALVFIVAAISDLILLNSYRQLENQTSLKHLQLVYRQIAERIEQIDVTAGDVALDLSDRYQKGSQLSLIDQRYFSEASLKLHMIDLAALYAADGRLITVRSIDCETGRYCEVEPATLAALKTLVTGLLNTPGSRRAGTVDIAGRPFMVSFKTLGKGTGSNAGILIVGCFLDKVELSHLERVTGVDAEIVPLATDRLSNVDAVAHSEILRSRSPVSQIIDQAHLSGYAHLKDLDGQPSHLLKITERRSLMDQGKQAIFYIMIMLFVCGVVFCTVTLMFVRRAVLKRLATLSATVGDISRNSDISSRLDVQGEDELETLADSINTMLASLETAESVIRESEQRYRMLFERAPDAIVIIGLDGEETGRIVAANQAAADLHGYTVEELCSRRIFDINTPETNNLSGPVMDQLSRGEWITTEVWHFKKDGTRFPLEVHAGPIKMNNRNYILGFDRDITSRKLAEEADAVYLEHIDQLNRELNAKAEALAAVNTELESFNYSVSHDLRGPLTRISGYCQLMLEEEAGVDQHLKTYLARIYESCCCLDGMIDAMLKLSRLSGMEFSAGEVNLSILAEDAIRELMLAEPERKVEAVVTPGLTVTGDAGMLKILMNNLIGNAWKYTARTESARLEFGVSNQGRGPVYYIRDNGAGFDMKDVSKLFRVFSRLHDASQFCGTGIGLATSQRIVLRHGGRIWAEGEVGRGAAFFFTLASEVQELPFT